MELRPDWWGWTRRCNPVTDRLGWSCGATGLVRAPGQVPQNAVTPDSGAGSPSSVPPGRAEGGRSLRQILDRVGG